MTPKKHNIREFSEIDKLYASVPGLEILERMYDGVDSVVFCIKDRSSRYLVVNDAFLRRARLTNRDQLVGRTAREVFPALLAAGYEQQDQQVFKTGHEIRDQLEMVTNPDGSFGWYLARKLPVRDASGKIVAVVGVSHDLHTASNHPRISRLAKSLEYIRKNFASPISIANVAKSAGMSLSGFLRLTQSVLGVSPRGLLTRLRVEEAARQLTETQLPLSQIALDCGFCDQPTLCRQFKLITGTTPLGYRKLKKGLSEPDVK